MVMDDQDQDSTGILWEMGQPLSFNFFLQLRDLYPHFRSLSQEGWARFPSCPAPRSRIQSLPTLSLYPTLLSCAASESTVAPDFLFSVPQEVNSQ